MDSLLSLVRNPSPAARNAMIISGLALASIAAYLSYAGKGSSNNNLAPALTEEETREILRSIVDRVKLTVPRLIKYGEGIKQQIAMQGQEIDDKQLYKSLLLPHLETGIRDIEQSILDENDVDNDEFEEAVNVYCAAGDKELINLAATLKKIYSGFGGEIEEEEEDSASGSDGNKATKTKKSSKSEVSLEELVEFLQQLSNAVLESTDEYARQFVAANGPPNDILSLQNFQLGLMSITERVENKLLEESGMSSNDFQMLIGKHQHQPSIQEIFYVMKIMNARVLQQHGIHLPEEHM